MLARGLGSWAQSHVGGQRVRAQRWLHAEARSEIRTRLLQEATRRERVATRARLLSQPGNRTALRSIAGYYLVLGIWVLVSAVWSPALLPEMRPQGGGGGIVSLWQVQAGLVAVALPFIFVLMPLVKDEPFPATRTAQLIMADTFINPILVFALGGVVWAGMLVLWGATDIAKWLAFAGVLVPSVLGVAFAYVRAARILADHGYVRAASRPLLLAMIDDYIIEDRSIEHANGALVNLLEGYGIQCLPMPPEHYVRFHATKTGRIADIDAIAVSDWLERLVSARRATAEFEDAEKPPEELPASATHAAGYWTALIGDTVASGRAFVSLDPSRLEDLDLDDMQGDLNCCLEVSPDDE